VADTHTDGINLDFEDPIPPGSPLVAALTALTSSLSDALHTQIGPWIQMSVDVAWSPDCIDVRCYDYAAMAQHSDLLFVMQYDEESQIFPPRQCIAYANDPLAWGEHGLQRLYRSVCHHKRLS